MEDIIHLLPDSVANQIAAGEVVQRPASIVKDAGATHIQVLITDGGKTDVQIIDNGKGMSATDARMAFERHATSKIQRASDLFTLNTMGFRGEALASIAAVAQVELKTRRPDDELGTYIQIAGSKIENQEPVLQCTGTQKVPKIKSDGTDKRRCRLSAHSISLPRHCLYTIQQRGRDVQSSPNLTQKPHHHCIRQKTKYRTPAYRGRNIIGLNIRICSQTRGGKEKRLSPVFLCQRTLYAPPLFP